MSQLTLNVVSYAGGGPHTRQPRNLGSDGGFNPIDNLSGSLGDLAAGSTFSVPLGLMPAQVTDQSVSPSVTYTFAFANVSGGAPVAGASLTSFDASRPPGPVTVGTSPIVVLVVYLPPPGGNGNGTGAGIDAFDETLGSLVNDTFVTVSPDPTGSLFESGNVDGWVVTTNTETIGAYAHIMQSNADFEKWVSLIAGLTPPAGQNFTAVQKTDYNILALYKASPAPPPGEVACEGVVEGIEKMISLGVPGPRFTVAEWKNVMANLERCVAEGYLTQARVNTLVAQYLAYAQGPHEPPSPSGLPKL